jgi:hypothetical protein
LQYDDCRGLRRSRVAALLAGAAVSGSVALAQGQPAPPPAGYGYPPAPPAGYGYGQQPPPGYGYPAPVAPPPPAQPLVIYGWDPDVEPPAGYELDWDANMGLVGGGIALVATGWTLSVLVGIAGATAEENEEEDHPASERDDVTTADWSPLYVPLVGPFIAIRTLDAEGWGLGLLLADGLMQAFGTVGIVLGAVDRDYKLVPSVAGVEVTPVWQTDFQGVVVKGAL